MVKSHKVSLQGSVDSVAPHEDGALLFRAKTGDAEAVSLLLSRYTPLVHKLSHSFGGVPESELEDLVQEGLIALHKAILLYDSSVSSFSTFAYLCVRHGMLSMLKKLNRITPTVSFDTLQSEPVSPQHSDPQVQIIDRENCEILLKKFDTALSDYESTVLKQILSGHSVKDAAQTLGKSEKSVSNALSRARQKLSLLLS